MLKHEEFNQPQLKINEILTFEAVINAERQLGLRASSS